MFRIKYLPLEFIPVLLVLGLLIPTTVFATGPGAQGTPPVNPSNNLYIEIGGQPVSGPLRQGRVIPQQGVAGECGNPSFLVRGNAHIQRIRIGQQEDSCDIEIKVLEINSNPFSTGADSALLTQAGYKWRASILAKIVGVNSVDDLTKTHSILDFKTASRTNTNELFNGVVNKHSCWAKWQLPAWFYKVKKCVRTSDTTSSTKMFVKTHGYYKHTVIPAFGHDVIANAIARWNKSMPNAVTYECTQNSKPIGSDLECEFSVTYKGYG